MRQDPLLVVGKRHGIHERRLHFDGEGGDQDPVQATLDFCRYVLIWHQKGLPGGGPPWPIAAKSGLGGGPPPGGIIMPGLVPPGPFGPAPPMAPSPGGDCMGSPWPIAPAGIPLADPPTPIIWSIAINCSSVASSGSCAPLVLGPSAGSTFGSMSGSPGIVCPGIPPPGIGGGPMPGGPMLGGPMPGGGMPGGIIGGRGGGIEGGGIIVIEISLV